MNSSFVPLARVATFNKSLPLFQFLYRTSDRKQGLSFFLLCMCKVSIRYLTSKKLKIKQISLWLDCGPECTGNLEFGFWEREPLPLWECKKPFSAAALNHPLNLCYMQTVEPFWKGKILYTCCRIQENKSQHISGAFKSYCMNFKNKCKIYAEKLMLWGPPVKRLF